MGVKIDATLCIYTAIAVETELLRSEFAQQFVRGGELGL
jgi:hypothetical protein